MALTEIGNSAKQLSENIDRFYASTHTPAIERLFILEELRQARLKQEQLIKSVSEASKVKT